MKKLTLSSITLFFLIIVLMSQNNYNRAIEAAKESEGSDSAIEETMFKYGFNCPWYEDISLTDKIIAFIYSPFKK